MIRWLPNPVWHIQLLSMFHVVQFTLKLCSYFSKSWKPKSTTRNIMKFATAALLLPFLASNTASAAKSVRGLQSPTYKPGDFSDGKVVEV